MTQTSVDGLSAWVLRDDAAELETTWVPEAGMLGASLVHRGQELLWQGAGVGGYAKTRRFMGIPFLHPWANRLDHFGYRAGGHEVELDPASSLLALDDNGLPIHGLLNATPRWSGVETAANTDGARLVASLNFDDPDLLAAFPFPHRLEMAIRLTGSGLEIDVTLTATTEEPVPVSFGFHPYLQLPGQPRTEWSVHLPVRRHLLLDARKIPTRVTEPADPITGTIGDRTWDDGFDRLGSPPRFRVASGGETVQVDFLEGYPVAQIFAPPGQQYLCIEPMTAPANALASGDGSLTWVRPGGQYKASFRIACSVSRDEPASRPR